MGDSTLWPAGPLLAGAEPAVPARRAGGRAGAPGPAPAAYCMGGMAYCTGAPVVWRLMRTDSSPSVISSSARPDSSSNSMSFLTLRISMEVLAYFWSRARELVAGRLEGQLVTQGAEPGDDANGHVGNVGVPPEFLPGVHVAEVNLDERDGHGQQRVPQRHAGVGQGAGVQQDEVHLAGGLLDPVDQGGLGIGLEGLQLVPGGGGGGGRGLLDVGQGRGAVQMGFPPAEQVQVGAVEQQEPRHRIGVWIAGDGREFTEFRRKRKKVPDLSFELSYLAQPTTKRPITKVRYLFAQLQAGRGVGDGQCTCGQAVGHGGDLLQVAGL